MGVAVRVRSGDAAGGEKGLGEGEKGQSENKENVRFAIRGKLF